MAYYNACRYTIRLFFVLLFCFAYEAFSAGNKSPADYVDMFVGTSNSRWMPVFLYDHKVEAELSATAHCGVQRYTFPEEEESRILIDLLFPSEYGFNVKDAKITKVDNSNIEGYAACESDSWSGWNDYNLYFVIKFSKPIRQFCGWTGGKIYEDVVEVTGKDDIGMYVVFSTDDGEQITVCSGLSLVSIDQARLNMESELEPLAYALDKTDEGKRLEERSKNYINVFHPDLKYVVQRDSSGQWDSSFDVFSNKGFIEGNSWQYSWYVPHDVPGLVALVGEDEFNARLETGFEKSQKHKFAAHFFDRTTGQSAEFYINHGNEVNMCTPYLFNYSGKPWLAQKWSRAILESFYGCTPYHGWEGDEDEGQMSAWFVLSSIGFFEMDGGCSISPNVDLGSPLFDRIEITLNSDYYNGDKFVIKAKGNSKANVYVQKASLNGQKLQKPCIPFSSITKGGKLVFKMGRRPAPGCYGQ